MIIVGYGQGLVILVRGLDLSIASVITLGAVLTTIWLNGSNDYAWIVLPGVILACAFVGCLSGIGVSYLRIPPFIMTLAAGIIVYSLCLGYTAGTPRGYSPPFLVSFMHARLGGIPVPIIFTFVFVVIAVVVQSWSTLGRRLYAIGNNPAAAYVAGLPTRMLTITAYAVSGGCAGLTGIMLAGYSNGATLRMGDDYLLPSVAAVVIGGSSILGGQGNFVGTVGGAILLTTLGTLLAAVGIEEGWKTIIEGGVIITALVLLREQFYDALRTQFGSKGN